MFVHFGAGGSAPGAMTQEAASPHLYVIAGPNGAGKTTFANRFLPDFVDVRHFVNADLIAAGLSPFAPDSVAVEAGRLMLKRIDDLSHQRADFGIESTLSGKTLERRLRAMKAVGYQVHLVYLWLAGPELAVARVTERVRQGGHTVPSPTIYRRYFTGLHHLFQLYLPLADDWAIYDNSGREPIAIAFHDEKGTRIVHQGLYETIERMGKL